MSDKTTMGFADPLVVTSVWNRQSAKIRAALRTAMQDFHLKAIFFLCKVG